MRRVLNLIDSPTPELVDEIMLSVARDELWKKRREEAVDVLKAYHKSGATIILISAAYEPAVQKFAGLIGKERTIGIGTPISLVDGTVRLAGIITSRDQKLRRLKEQIGDTPVDLALGDTFADIPLLEGAKKAIAVYPDKTLRKTAVERNWQIIGD